MNPNLSTPLAGLRGRAPDQAGARTPPVQRARTNPVARCRKALACLLLPRYRQALLQHGVAAAVEHAAVLRALAPCATVVDVGANRGQFALVARQCFPGARVVSFEPLVEPARTFERVFRGDGLICVQRTAIGRASGQAEMHVSARDDSSSLLEITPLQASAYPGTQESHVSTVEVARLGEVVPRDEIRAPALLKIDVQGFELGVLEGSEDVLSLFASVYLECSFAEFYRGQPLAAEVMAWLGARGFRLAGVYNVTYDAGGVALQGDFLFQRQ